MTKSIEDNFADWEGNVFGFGYGTGEDYTIPALKTFLQLCGDAPYDYKALEAELSPPVAWLLINILCRHDVIEYGTSPRVGWLTKQGHLVREFVMSKSAEDLIEIVNGRGSHDYVPCYPDACNCGPEGYEEGRLCPNPFWNEKQAKAK